MKVDFKPKCPLCFIIIDTKAVIDLFYHIRDEHKDIISGLRPGDAAKIWQLEYKSYLVSKEFKYCCNEFRLHVSTGDIEPCFPERDKPYWHMRLQQENVFYPFLYCPWCASKLQEIEQ